MRTRNVAGTVASVVSCGVFMPKVIVLNTLGSLSKDDGGGHENVI